MRFCVVAALVLLAAAPVDAKPEDPKIAAARQHYEAGLAHYNLEEYRDAVVEFEAAYRLRPDPVFLYNLGQAYRLGDNPEQALHFYRAYLRTLPAAPNRAEVEGRITDLEQVVAAKKNAAARPPEHALPRAEAPAGTTTTTTTTTTPPSAPQRRSDAPAGRRLRLAGLAVGGVGVASLGVAVGFSVLAKQASDKLTNGTPSSMYDFGLDRTGRNDESAAIALYVVGGAAVAAGVLVYAVGRQKDRGHARAGL
ncbi:MAG: hypothetical protein LC659_10200 [Myxococcales bacterium]|nr:hypothetical protein [Myxococcales bacterium]